MEFLPYIIDIVMLIIVVGSVFDGRRRGFVKMVLAIVAMIVSWIVAREYSEPIAQWFVETFIHARLTDSISETITANIGGGAQTVLEALPEYVKAAIEQAGLSADSLLASAASAQSIAEISEKIYSAASNVLILPVARGISLFVVFSLCEAVLSIIIVVINRIFKLPVLKSLNRMLGALLGAAKGIFGVGIVCMVLYLISSVTPETALAKAVDNSMVYTFVMTILNSFISI